MSFVQASPLSMLGRKAFQRAKDNTEKSDVSLSLLSSFECIQSRLSPLFLDILISSYPDVPGHHTEPFGSRGRLIFEAMMVFHTALNGSLCYTVLSGT